MKRCSVLRRHHGTQDGYAERAYFRAAETDYSMSRSKIETVQIIRPERILVARRNGQLPLLKFIAGVRR